MRPSGRVLMLNPEAQAVLKRLNIKLQDVIDQRIMDLLRKWCRTARSRSTNRTPCWM